MSTPRRSNTFTDVMERVDRPADPDACWLWTGACTAAGYGLVSMRMKKVYVHRLVYTELVGPIEPDKYVDHLCRNPKCCNPKHLEPVPPGVNTSRGLLGLTLTGYCRKGLHDVTQPDTLVEYRPGKWTCRECRIRARQAADHRRRHPELYR